MAWWVAFRAGRLQSEQPDDDFIDRGPCILNDEIRVFDHAVTRSWTVDKKFVRNPDPRRIGASFISR
jgi:hypothetical protein